MKLRLGEHTDTKFTEQTLLAYFQSQFKAQKASTRWSHYSMLKLTLRVKKGISFYCLKSNLIIIYIYLPAGLNIASFYNFLAYLKRMSAGYQPKKSKIF